MASEENTNNNTTGNGETVAVKKETSSSSDSERDKALNSSQITNSEDAKMVKARIFVGNLPADLRTEKGELYDKFVKHGRILGVSIHNRFAFVQFETEEDAKSAVKAENHSEFRSARLELKMAIEGRQNRDNNRDKRPRSRSPMDRRDRDRDRDSRDRRRDSRDRRADSRDRYSRNRSPPPYVPSAVEDRFCHPRTYGSNDVEIIVIRKQQGQYAEGILKRLSDRKLSANMLFLSETAPLEGAVAEFGRCGTHYVITVMPRHEETRAITINMFEGNDVPKIYRNINVDDGCDVIAGHFREHYPALLRLRSAENQGPHFYPPAPAEVTRTLNRVAELCAVPTSSLDATLRYLQEMRDRTAQWEGLSSQSSMVMPGQNAYRGADMDTGKAYGMIDMTGGRTSNGVGGGGAGVDAAAGDSIRESLLGLLKATSFNMNGAGNTGVGLAGAYPGAPATGAYGGYGAAGSQASVAGLSADPILQKALASLVGTGLLNQAATGPSPTQTPQAQNSQNNNNNNIPASYRSSSTAQVTDENGGGGGGYSSQTVGGRSSDYSSASTGGRTADYGSQSVGGRSADYSNQSVGGRSSDNGYNTQGGGGSGADVSGGYGGQSGVTGGRASYGTTGGTVGYGGQQSGAYGATGSGSGVGGSNNQANSGYGQGTGQAGSAYGSSGGQTSGGYSSQQSGGYGVGGGGQNITRTIAGTNVDRTPQPAAYSGMNAAVGGYQQQQQQQQQQQGQQSQTGLQRGQPTGAYAARR